MPSPEDMLSAVASSVRERTGRTLDEWVELVRGSGVDPLDQNAVRAWLRDVHGVRQNTQWAIADAVAVRARWVRPTVEQYVEQQYVGRKSGLRLPSPPDSPRLHAAKAPGRATHKLSLTSAADVDDEVRALLRAAYEQSP